MAETKTIQLIVGNDERLSVPEEVTRQLELKPGDMVLATIQGGKIVLVPGIEDPVAALCGLWSEIWQGEDAQEYLDRERDPW
ncbi:MAG: AbrB/MazE/SpoVT family DNA-binding domain-containing protein [Thermomicrobiales bacterium]|nr:AbrB/MazE/SpoVT family DNA-binding domain-containing protein [Thermomicrobiales bacterium]